jgi:hypothetical protein
MSYTLEFWAAPVDTFVGELARGGLAAEVLPRIGEYVDSIAHSSSGGEWFRDEFVEGTLAGLIGAEAARSLVDRVPGDGYPSLGWLTRTELATAITHLNEAGDAALTTLTDEDAAELLEPLVDILRATAATGQDLVTVYS